MEIIDNNNNNNENEMWRKWERSHRRGRVFGGFILVGIGVLFLMKEMGVEIPHWIFTWKMLLIVLGLFIGVKHAFRHVGWIVLVTIGSAFLIEDLYPGIKISFIIIPALIIFAGLFMIFRPKRKCREHRYKKWHQYQDWKRNTATGSSEDYIDSTSVFGSVKKNIISKDFKGGDVSAFFGSAEVNLSQADINGKVVLELSQAFGGTRLIVPPHWEIQSELVSVFGGIADKRPVHKEVHADASKILVLKGTCFFGGIEITSY